MLNELLEAALTLVVGFLLRLALASIGVEIDPVLFNTIVAAIVLWILKNLGIEMARALVLRFAPGRYGLFFRDEPKG